MGIATGTVITTSQLTTGLTSTSDTDDTFNAPNWATGTRYLFFAVPTSTGDISMVTQTGAALGDVPVIRAITMDFTFGATQYKVWRTTDAWPAAFGGSELTIVQA